MPPYQFIIKLIKVINQKKELISKLEELTKPIADIVEDVAWGIDEKHRRLIAYHSTFFHQEKGALPLVNKLIELNGELVHYQDDSDTTSIRDNSRISMSKNLAQCGLEIHRSYLRMMALVAKENYLLVKSIKPIFEEIKEGAHPTKAWSDNLSHYTDFLDFLKADIRFAHMLSRSLKARGYLDFLMKPTEEEIRKGKGVIANNVVKSIENNDFNQARYWIRYGKWREWFDNDETKTLNDLIFFIEQQDAFQLGQLIESEIFKKIFDEKEAGFFEGIVNELSQKYILTLKPLNSVPNDSTDIISIYHKYKKDALQIGKGDECDIQIVDSYIDDDVQAEIMFIINKNRFIIIRTSKKTEIKINNNLIERKFGFLDDGCIIDINGYEFQATIKPTKMLVISLKEYNQLFENKILRLPKLQIGTIQLAENLTDEVKELGELKKVAEEAEAPEWTIGKVDEQTKKDEETVFVLGEVAPEIKKIPEVKKLKKSRWRLKVSLKLPRIKKGYKNKREAINKGLAVLKESINLKNRLFDFIKYKLAKEKKEIEVMEQQAYSLTKKPPEGLLKERLITGKQVRERIDNCITILGAIAHQTGVLVQKGVKNSIISTLQMIKEHKKSMQEAIAQLKLESARMQVKRELINAVQQNNFEHAKLWIAHAQKNGLFNEEEISLFTILVDNLVSIEYKERSISKIYDDLLSIISVIESGRRRFLGLMAKGAAAGLVTATGLSLIDKLSPHAAIRKDSSTTEIGKIPQEEIKILFVGDTMFPQAASEKSWWKKQHINEDPHIYFRGTEDYIKNADLAIGNLEMPISDNKGTPIEGEKWHFKGPSFLAKILADVGFKAMSLANNHTLNYGPIGLADTIRHLKEAGVHPFGAGEDMYEARKPIILNVKGYRIGILGYCIGYIVDLLADANKAGSAPYKSYDRIDFTKERAYNYETYADDDRIQDIYPEDKNYLLEDLQKLRGKSDIIIIFFHWGREIGKRPFNYQRHIAQMAIDNGAKIIVGAGPHVPGEVEEYNNGIIAYSLGNFLFGSKSRYALTGSMLEVTLKGGKITEARDYLLDVNNFGSNAFNPSVIGEPTQFV